MLSLSIAYCCRCCSFPRMGLAVASQAPLHLFLFFIIAWFLPGVELQPAVQVSLRAVLAFVDGERPRLLVVGLEPRQADQLLPRAGAAVPEPLQRLVQVGPQRLLGGIQAP